MKPTLYVDVRHLQDPNYRVRGIGQHVAGLLRTRIRSPLSRWQTIALVDLQLPALPAEFAALVDTTSASLNPCHNSGPSIFLDPAPITNNDTHFALAFENHPALLRVAVVYDFIPLDWPGYLTTVAQRIAYLAKLARLRKFDAFLPISQYTALRTRELLGVSEEQMTVTGAPVRNNLYALSRDPRTDCCGDPKLKEYFVTVIAADPRKNTEAVVRAVRHLNLLYDGRFALKVVGHYQGDLKARLLSLAGHAEGDGFLQFCIGITDEELIRLYKAAIATVMPSHIEGFSLPIVEASLCRCPVIASTCAAHLELIHHPEALFASHDPAELCSKLDSLINKPSLREDLIASQSRLAETFCEDAVGGRAWSGIEAAVGIRRRSTLALRLEKPRLAFLGPFPPDLGGAALRVANTVRRNASLFQSDIYTDAQRPLTCEGSFRDSGMVSLAPLTSGAYNAVIAVISNCFASSRAYQFHERYGGPCILDDPRLLEFHLERLGEESFLEYAAKVLNRPIVRQNLQTWLLEWEPAPLFLDAIVKRASPLIVHSKTAAAQIKSRYGIEAHVTLCCPTQFFDNEELKIAPKNSARERLGLDVASFNICCFGSPNRVKGMETSVYALELLRGWNIPAQLHFVGRASSRYNEELPRICHQPEILQYVHYSDQLLDENTYRDYLIASDAGVQLSFYAQSQTYSGLTDCISAGLPSVTSRTLAESSDGPEYVSVIPDRFSPLQVAEALALIWESQTDFNARKEARHEYLETHTYEHYGKRLIETLGVA